MKCSAYRERLAAYQDGSLSQAAAADVEEHLRSCVGCRAFSEEMMVVERRLARLTEIEPRADFTLLVMAKIAALPAPSRPRVRMWWLGAYDLVAWAILAALTATGIFRWKVVAAESGLLFGKISVAANALYRVADHFHLTTLALVGGLVEGGVMLLLLYAGRRYLAAMQTAFFGAQTT